MTNLLFFLFFPFLVHSQISLYSTFNNIGITYTSSSSSICDTVQYCLSGTSTCFGGFELTKSTDRSNTFYGSLLWLNSSTSYDVTVVCDQDNDSETIETKKDLSEYYEGYVFANEKFVSSSGSGVECSPTNPCSVEEMLNNHLQPGTKVHFENGIYKVGNLNIGVSGTSLDLPILFTGSSSEDVIFDGSVTMDSLQPTSTNGIYEFTLPSDMTNTNLVIMIDKNDGTIQRLLEYLDETEFENLEYENFGFHISGTTLSINIGTDEDVLDYEFRYSQFTSAFTIGSTNFMYFENLQFRFYGEGAYPKALYYDTSSYGWIKNCLFDHNDRSIGIKRQTDDMLIENCLFRDSRFAFSWTGVKSNAHNMEGGALSVYASDPMPARGLVFRNNEVHDFFDCVNLAPGYTSGNTLSNEMDIHDNYIYRCGDDALELDGLATNSRVYSNVIEDALCGVSLAPAIIGPTTVVNNIIRGLGKGFQTHSSYTGMAFKFNVDSSYDSGTMYIFHNFVQTNNAGSSAHVIHEHRWDDIILRNNVLIGNEYAISVAFTDYPLDFDYDALYSLEDGELCYWAGLSDRHLNDIAELRSSVSQEPHGIQLDNLTNVFDASTFIGVDGGPLKGKGLPLTGINNDVVGEVDIGLLEGKEIPSRTKTNFKIDKEEEWVKVVVSSILGVLIFGLSCCCLLIFACCIIIASSRGEAFLYSFIMKKQKNDLQDIKLEKTSTNKQQKQETKRKNKV